MNWIAIVSLLVAVAVALVYRALLPLRKEDFRSKKDQNGGSHQ